METEIKGADGIARGAEIIKSGDIVAFPTETVYGLGGDALNATAIKKIFEAKGRPQDNPLIVHISDKSQAEGVAHVTPAALALFERFAPGPLTVVLKKKDCIPSEVTAGLDTVGIRIPRHDIARRLISLAGTPVAAPSANTSSRISPTTAAHVYEDMKGRIPLILDGGQCEIGIESTVLDMSGEVPVILRPGAVTIEMLLEVLPMVMNSRGELKVAKAPGMKYKHYAPVVACALASSAESAKKFYARLVADGHKPVIIGRKGYVSDASIKFMDAGDTAAEVARNIYKLLRDAEKLYDYIIIEKFSDTDLEYSIMNRLIKSTQGVII
ncbi:MAG: L-threonylcarbamoyladenylate synthase [Clostridia bacterium]|nr:L-threonylcarbamoyladenylate synthase [Clostridia bacterium]